MADKIPAIVDNRGDNTVLQALQNLAPNLRWRNIARDAKEGTHGAALKGVF